MTGDESLLFDVKPFNGGHVSFAGEVGGEIMKQGKVSNGTLTFEEVNLVEELNHNLFSVSQICFRYMSHLRSQGPPLNCFGPTPLKSKASSSEKQPITIDTSRKSSPANSPPPSPRPGPMAENNRTMYQQGFEGFHGDHSPIVAPEIDNPNSWQIPSYVMTNITQHHQFHGREDEDAPAHINRLTRVFKTFNLQGANEDVIFLHLILFTLSGRAATWIDSQLTGAFTTWEALRNAFIKKYFPPAKASRLFDQIHSFHMEPDEAYYQAWERFQNLLFYCSQHGLIPWALVEKFYNGLTYEAQARFDTAARGNLMEKKNNLTQEIKELKAKVDKCEMCRGGHGTLECPLMNNQDVDFVVGQNRFRNAYNNNNQNWNSYKNQNRNQGQGNSNWRPAGGPPGFQAPYKQNQGQHNNEGSNGQSSNNVLDLSKKLDEMMQQIVTRDQATQKTLAEHDLIFKNQQLAMLNLQRTIGDIARQLKERPWDSFQRQGFGPEVRRNEVEVEDEEVMDEGIEMEVPGKVHNTAPVAPPVEKKPIEVRPSPLIDHSRIPYPARAKHQKYTWEYGHFLDMFRHLKINLPFIEALQHMPNVEPRTREVIGSGVFTIPCLFGSDEMSHALADLGASINLMPYSLYEKLELGELTSTRMSLSLADHSVTYPRGIIENLLVKVNKFVFPVDFVVLNMEANEKVPIILGRSFLRTAKALIDVYDG
ncbi:uncharacterized protein LOC143625691 [Bidens hawaiensis]|uniref:uncharacterized protein LOC143625691 n=1 Tax=Bidens hawaiensis TaxID=980011 RepID=UPI00404B9663